MRRPAQIGVGRMGEVYRARDMKLDRDVVIKVLPSHVVALVEFLNRDVAIGGFLDIMRGVRKRLRETASKRVVVVCDQNPPHVMPLLRCRIPATSLGSASRARVPTRYRQEQGVCPFGIAERRAPISHLRGSENR